MQKKNIFLAKSKEDSKFNQYWFSQNTIEALVDHITVIAQEYQEINEVPMQICFVSTPSIYCSMKDKTNSVILEFDLKFNKEKNFVFYDFNKPTELPEEMKGKFNFILIDPPFITLEVWAKYADTAKFLLAPQGKLLLCSIKENEIMLKTLLNVDQRLCKPSIPNLIYQYNYYSNYNHQYLDTINLEVGY